MVDPIRVAVLTVSDRCSRGEMTDTAGPSLARLCTERLNAELIASTCVADDKDAIAGQLCSWAGEWKPDLILTTGGTGLGPRDITPEATVAVLERRHPGLLELARMRCAVKTPRAFLSRGEAGTIGRSLIINLPGSQRGACEYLEALVDVVPHAIQMIRGEPDDHVPPPAVNARRIPPSDDLSPAS